MKFFQIFLLAVSIAFGNIAFAQKLPSVHDWFTKQYIRKDYTLFTDYIEEYASRLYDNLEIKENFPWYANLGLRYDYYINKDGSISNFKIYRAADEYIEYINRYTNPVEYYYTKKYSRSFEDYVKKVILENPPEPFPQDFEYDSFKIEIEVVLENKKESKLAHKEFNYYFNIDKKNIDLCAFNMNGGNTLTADKKRFVPPHWAIKIIKFR